MKRASGLLATLPHDSVAGGLQRVKPPFGWQLVLLSVVISAGFSLPLGAQATTERVSVDSNGMEGNIGSGIGSISAYGRYVAFISGANNLVPNDTNNAADTFVHDRQTGLTQRVSVDSSGVEGDGRSYWHSISADGRFVAFSSDANNLVPGDISRQDVFVHDRQTGDTERVSVDQTGIGGFGDSDYPSISADGRFVAFSSTAANLVPGDENNDQDVFVHDRQTGEIARVSVDSSGGEGNGDSGWWTAISADGRFVAFESDASNLVPLDTNHDRDVFVHDRQTGITERVSVDSSGSEGNGWSIWPSISADGRYVVFESQATNLVPDDTNFTSDIFIRDRQTGLTNLVGEAFDGGQLNGSSRRPSISPDGRFVAFQSDASNLIADDTNGTTDTFVNDRQTGLTTRVSVDSGGDEGNGYSGYPSISSGGHFVAFFSFASNLVPDDINGYEDTFVRFTNFVPIFDDGFESGSTFHWSTTVP